MREIVTVQVGGFANFVGSHFWNFQDELLGLADDPQSDPVFKNRHLNMDVLYRTGETLQGTCTYVPRLVSIGFRGSLGSTSSRGTLYKEDAPASSDVLTWTGNVSTHKSEPQKKNLFLQSLYEEEHENAVSGENSDTLKEIQDKDIVESLDKDIKYWTDFSKVHYHPQSLYELHGLWTDQEFDSYGIGTEAFTEGLQGEDICERLRYFVEECDHIQGFQFIVDDSGGYPGLTAEFLETIADEYTNTPVLLYSVHGPGPHLNINSKKQSVTRNLHDAVSFSRLSSLCKLIVPVGLPFLSGSKASNFLHINDENPYHCSAVYAAALHTNSIPLRMEPLGPAADSSGVSGALDVNGIVQILAGQGRQNMVGILDVSMPAPALSGDQVEKSYLGNLQPLTPELEEDVEDMQAVEIMTVLGAFGSGAPRSNTCTLPFEVAHQDSQHCHTGRHRLSFQSKLQPGVRRASVSEVKNTINAAYEHATTRPMFSHLSVAPCPLPIPLPFPSIFGNLIGQHGELLSSPISGSQLRGSLDVHSIPMAARLRSSNAVLPFLRNRLGNLCRFGLERGASGTELLRTWGFGKDDVEDIKETLSKMVSTLDPHSQDSSDSD